MATVDRIQDEFGKNEKFVYTANNTKSTKCTGGELGSIVFVQKCVVLRTGIDIRASLNMRSSV